MKNRHFGFERQVCCRDRLPFSIAGATPHYAPDVPFKMNHLFLNVEVHPTEKWVKGSITHEILVVSPGQKFIVLDQVDLKILSVHLSEGEALDFFTEGHKLKVRLPQERPVGQSFKFTVNFEVQNPRRGLYFTGPDADYPQKPFQVWSQGQDEDNRYWFPTFDYPNQKATSEVQVRVPKGFMALSNGALLSQRDLNEKTSEFHYRLGTPHVTYLITLVVGKFSAWKDKGPHDVPVEYYVDPGREEDGKRAFDQTPKMIEAFEKKIGVQYPYEKYSQVAVQDFIFGGMENTSATTQTDLTLHDARAHLDFSSDPLVSHELAHQWFGDLLTCRDWSHGWLNEGFATFMERVWIEEKVMPNSGAAGREVAWSEAKYYSYQDLKEYLDDDSSRYRRPIVCNTYIEPIDLFDTHLYQKGGLVLNFLRGILGDELFWKSIHHYVEKHRTGSVETIDLIRAIEDVTGRNLRKLFDQWVFSGGVPEFSVSYAYDEKLSRIELKVEQKQTGGDGPKTEKGVTTPIFELPIWVEVWTESKGAAVKTRECFEIKSAHEKFTMKVDGKVLSVRLDPDFWIPKKLNFPRPKELLLYQLKNDVDVMGRIEAAQELAKEPSREILEILAQRLVEDSFWGVQAEIAAVLPKFAGGQEKLILALPKVGHPKSRRAVVKALGEFLNSATAHALGPLAKSDPSYFVQAEAILNWARAEFKVAKDSKSNAWTGVVQELQKIASQKSYRDVLAGYVAQAMAFCPEIERGPSREALDWIKAASRRGQSMDLRLYAIGAMGRVLERSNFERTREILDHFEDLARADGEFRVRMKITDTLSHLGREEGLPLLEWIQAHELDGRVKRHALEGAEKLRTQGTAHEQIADLKEQFSKLKEKVERLEQVK